MDFLTSSFLFGTYSRKFGISLKEAESDRILFFNLKTFLSNRSRNFIKTFRCFKLVRIYLSVFWLRKTNFSDG